ncbi:MAG: hypothetical protein MZV64_09415 [Ignavibacteriales bacterium]|nr:hypothetical protein [Ignavibacteriales bacterium]
MRFRAEPEPASPGLTLTRGSLCGSGRSPEPATPGLTLTRDSLCGSGGARTGSAMDPVPRTYIPSSRQARRLASLIL